MESSVFIDLIVWGIRGGGGGGGEKGCGGGWGGGWGCVKTFAVRLAGFIRVSKP